MEYKLKLAKSSPKNVVAVRDADPENILMRIWIQLPIIMQIHADPYLHYRQNSGDLEAQNGAMEAYIEAWFFCKPVVVDLIILTRSRIRICIKVESRIQIRIETKSWIRIRI
jgi:hypothetical protein